MLIHNAGLACKRNRDYQEAEELYLISLKIRIRARARFDPNEREMSKELSNLCTLYDEWTKSQIDHSTGSVRRSDEFEVYIPLMTLLNYVGWDGFGKLRFAIDGQMYNSKGVLKNKYCRPPKKAAGRLLEVLLSDGPSKFRSLLYISRNINVTNNFMPAPVPVPAYFANNEANVRKTDKKVARSVLAAERTFVVQCSHCSRGLVNPFSCPCQTVYYCNKECQKAHWKAGGHKRICPKFAKPAS
jgi:hypothetical protein